MIKLSVFLVLVFNFNALQGSKLNVPRVLLPLFNEFSTNFTLKVEDSGCFSWKTLQSNIITLQPLYVDPGLGCSSEVLVTPATRDFHRNTETVLAEDVHSGMVFRCEVILDVISSLSLITTTREIFLDESPEAFDVRAYDDQGNQFSTLEGVRFDWQFQAVGQATTSDKSKESPVLRFNTFHDSPYQTPPSVAVLDSIGQKGHIILLEGAQTGVAYVSVRLPYIEYKNVESVEVQLMVLTNLIIVPADAVILDGDQVRYRLYQVQHGKVNHIEFPSKQYYLKSENLGCVMVNEAGLASGRGLCKTKLVLVDRNVASAVGTDSKPPTALVTVAAPDHISLAILPARRWSVIVGHHYEILAEVFDVEGRQFILGDRTEAKIQLEEELFRVEYVSSNGTYLRGSPLKKGQTKVRASLLGVTDSTGVLRPSKKLTAEATMLIYDPLEVVPSRVYLPWDPVVKCKYEVPLTARGGDGSFQWTSNNQSVAAVTQVGVVRTLEVGTATITAAMTRNPYNRGTSAVHVAAPHRLQILDTVMDADVGKPLQLHLVLYLKMNGLDVPFTICDALPFEVTIREDNFEHIPRGGTKSAQRVVQPACSSVTVVGRSPGATRVTIKYRTLEATAVVAAHGPLVPFNPESGTTLLTVGTSRRVGFVGGPRPWALRPTEHSHVLYCDDALDCDTDIVTVTEAPAEDEQSHRDLYVYSVQCLALGQTVLKLVVANKAPGSASKPTEASATITVVCGKPRYVNLVPVARLADATRCPLYLSSERIIAQNYRDIHLQVVVTDAQGHKFDNFSSLTMDWSLKNQHLAQLINTETLSCSTQTLEGYEWPGNCVQVVQPKRLTGLVDIRLKVPGYCRQYLDKQGIVGENPAFPEKNKRGYMETPSIATTLSLTLANDTVLEPNMVELLEHPETRYTVKVSQGSGFYDLVVSAPDIVNMSYLEEARSMDLAPVSVGSVSIALVDLCLDADPAVLEVKVYRVGGLVLDVPERVERGKAVTAVVGLLDEDGRKLATTPDVELLQLRSVTESGIIKVKSGTATHQPGDVRYLVSGMHLGDTHLKFTALTGGDAHEIYSRSAPIQVFPALRLAPRNITLLVGSTFQVSTFEGPAGGSVEFSVDSDAIARVNSDGVVEALKVGKTVLVGRSVSWYKETDSKIVDSQDEIHVNVVPLRGVSIRAPLTRLEQGAVMPVWVSGRPEELDSSALGSNRYDIQFHWDVNHENLGCLRTIFHDMGVDVPVVDRIAMRFEALQPGRVTISLNVEAPSQVLGSAYKNTLVDSLVVDILPALALTRPRPLHLAGSTLLMTVDSETQLRTNRDGMGSTRTEYFVTPLPAPPGVGTAEPGPVVTVSAGGKIQSTSSYGRAAVTLATVDESGSKTWHSLVVDVKPVHYMMLNVDSNIRIRGTEVVQVLPNGLDVDFHVSFHDNLGRQFDAARANLQVESSQKGCLQLARGDTNHSLVVSLLDSGSSVVKVWDDDLPQKPADLLKIRSGAVIFPVSRQVTAGDVVCFRMPLTYGEDATEAWSVSDPDMLAFYPDIAVGVVGCKPGVVTVGYQSRKRLTTSLEVVPVRKLELLPTEQLLSTAEGGVYRFPLVLKGCSDCLTRDNNLVSFNGTCNRGSDAVRITNFPYVCQIRFNSPDPSFSISDLFTVSPEFNTNTGQYSCAVKTVGQPGKRFSTLSDSITLRATTLDHTVKSQPLVLAFIPGLYISQTEIRLSRVKPSDELTLTGTADVLVQTVVLSEYPALLSADVVQEKGTSTVVRVTVLSSWWNMEDPPQLSILVWSKLTDQKLKVAVRPVGHRLAQLDGEEWSGKWISLLLVLAATSLVVYSKYFRRTVGATGFEGDAYLQGSHRVHELGNTPRQANLSNISNLSNLSQLSASRPFAESPVYGSPSRRPVYDCRTPLT